MAVTGLHRKAGTVEVENGCKQDCFFPNIKSCSWKKKMLGFIT